VKWFKEVYDILKFEYAFELQVWTLIGVVFIVWLYAVVDNHG